MPNYAYTDYHISGKETEIKKLYDILLSLDTHPDYVERTKKYYGSHWWGYFLEALVGEIPEGVDVRGEICSYSLESPTCITMMVESAYHAPYAINTLIKHVFPSVRILYWGGPDDDGTMETNDRNCEVFRWRLGIAKEDKDNKFFDNEESMCTWLKETYGLDFSSLEDVRDYIDNNEGWTLYDECFVNED